MAKIYISSTYEDLKEHRKAVSEILQKAGHQVVAMETYVASDRRPLERCLGDVASCDIYVGIFAWRYGHIPDKENPHRKSITELEYCEATKLKKPRLIFFAHDDWPVKLTDVDRTSIQSLREKTEKGKLLRSIFTAPEGLAGDVAVAVTQQLEHMRGLEEQTRVVQRESDSRRRYLRNLQDECRAFSLVMLRNQGGAQTVTLGDVYTDLDTTVTVPKEVLAQIKNNEITEWTKVQGRFPTPQSKEDSEDFPRLPALDAFRLTPYFVLLGDPGSGKSSFVRMVVAQLIDELPRLPHSSPYLVPVLVVLRDVAPRLCHPELHHLSHEAQVKELTSRVWDQMVEDLDKKYDAKDFEGGLRTAVNNGHCLFVFDGLDEVPADDRANARRAVCAMIERYKPLRVIVTCRKRSYVGPAVLRNPEEFPFLRNLEEFTLAAFSRKQIQNFANRWYKALYGETEAARRKAQDLTELCAPEHDSHLYEVASNPMLLATMALIHHEKEAILRERVRLYKEAVEMLLFHRARRIISEKSLPEILQDKPRALRMMERLAYTIHASQQGGQSGDEGDVVTMARSTAWDILFKSGAKPNQADEFLNYVDERAGLLVGRGGKPDSPEEYGFPHKTFQEYLAACYLLTGDDRERVKRFYAHAADGDRWNLVAQLGAEEFRYNCDKHSEGKSQLLFLAYTLLPNDLTTERNRRAGLWSGQMAALVGREHIEHDTSIPNGGKAYLACLLWQTIQLLDSNLAASERAQAGGCWL